MTPELILMSVGGTFKRSTGCLHRSNFSSRFRTYRIAPQCCCVSKPAVLPGQGRDGACLLDIQVPPSIQRLAASS